MTKIIEMENKDYNIIICKSSCNCSIDSLDVVISIEEIYAKNIQLQQE